MADEHGVAGGPYNHAEHGEPDVSHALGGLRAIADTQHVAHGLEESVGVLHTPRVVLQTERNRRSACIDLKVGLNYNGLEFIILTILVRIVFNGFVKCKINIKAVYNFKYINKNKQRSYTYLLFLINLELPSHL